MRLCEAPVVAPVGRRTLRTPMNNLVWSSNSCPHSLGIGACLSHSIQHPSKQCQEAEQTNLDRIPFNGIMAESGPECQILSVPPPFLFWGSCGATCRLDLATAWSIGLKEVAIACQVPFWGIAEIACHQVATMLRGQILRAQRADTAVVSR
jgi:hypothetical protein